MIRNRYATCRSIIIIYVVVVGRLYSLNESIMKLVVLTCYVSFTSQFKGKNNVKQTKFFTLNMVY